MPPRDLQDRDGGGNQQKKKKEKKIGTERRAYPSRAKDKIEYMGENLDVKIDLLMNLTPQQLSS